jgi:hypothetical protein
MNCIPAAAAAAAAGSSCCCCCRPPPQALFDHIPVGVGSQGIIPTTAKDLEAALEMGMDWSLRCVDSNIVCDELRCQSLLNNSPHHQHPPPMSQDQAPPSLAPRPIKYIASDAVWSHQSTLFEDGLIQVAAAAAACREGYSWAEDKEHCEEYGRMLNADPTKVRGTGQCS